MEAKALSISKLFKQPRQYVIPVFQRHYVWDRESQWEPLWEDIVSQARVRLDHGTLKPHYCGAIVIDNKKQGVDDLPRFDVIDGQQRLTTFQVILAALRDLANALGLDEQVKQVVPITVNDNAEELSSPEIDQFKLRLTRYDQESFRDVLSVGSREKLRQKYIDVKKAKQKVEMPNIVGAYFYFYDQLSRALEQKEDLFGSEAHDQTEIFRALLDTFVHFFQAVMITLDDSDDAQIIFESLNSRGTPLLASDLMRNNVFFRAEQDLKNVDDLFDNYWSVFEERFWTKKERQGRLEKPRIEFFMVNALSARTSSEVHHSEIYQEYQSWVAANRLIVPVEQELADLVKVGAVYRNLIEASGDPDLSAFAKLLQTFDLTTIFPFVLAVWTEGPTAEGDRRNILADLRSFLIRRFVCRRTAKNYNRFFLSAHKDLRPKGFRADAIRSFLLQQSSTTSDWPTDDDLQEAWLTRPAYGSFPSPRLVYLLREIEAAERSRFSEDVTINSTLTVEHVMPREWYATWALKDGTFVTEEFAMESRQKQLIGLHVEANGKEAARREIAIDTFGNLTLLTRPLNSSVNNGPFEKKRNAISEQSALRLNRYFANVTAWDEERILVRGREMLESAKKIWGRPTST